MDGNAQPAQELISWQAVKDDFAAALDVLRKGVDAPVVAWLSLSKVLSKHGHIIYLRDASGLSITCELPLLASTCTALVLDVYKYHQADRRRDLSQLCRLTAQLYRLSMGAALLAGQDAPGVQFSLAKQAKISKILTVLQDKVVVTTKELMETVQDVYSTAARARAATEAGNKYGKAAAAADAVVAFTSDLRLASSLLQLFGSISTCWPGQVGLLSSKDAPALAANAATLAHTIYIVLGTTSSISLNTDTAEEAFSCVFETMDLLGQQLQLMMKCSQQTLAGQKLLNSSGLLEVHLMHVSLQLHSAHAAAEIRCVRCSTAADSHNSDVPLIGTANCNRQSIHNSSSMGAAAGPLDGKCAPECTACIRCLRRRKLGCLLQAGTAPPGSIHDLLQSRAAAHNFIWQLQLLETLLENTRKRKWDNWREAQAKEPVDKVSPYMPALTVTLLDLANFWCRNGRDQTAAAALGAARAAAAAWKTSSGLRVDYSGTASLRVLDDLELPCVQECVQQVTELLQQLYMSQVNNSSSSSRSLESYGGMVQSLFHIAAGASEVPSNLYQGGLKGQKGQRVKRLVFHQLLQPAMAAAEASIRLVATGAATGCTQVSAACVDAAGSFVMAGRRQFTYDAGIFACPSVAPATHASGSQTTVLSAAVDAEAVAHNTAATAHEVSVAAATTAASADTLCNPAYTDTQLFALLVSLLKLQSSVSDDFLTHRVHEAAAEILKLIETDEQVASAATFSAALPWLLLRARALIAEGPWMTRQLAEIQQVSAAEASSSSSSKDRDQGTAGSGGSTQSRGLVQNVHEWGGRMWLALNAFCGTCDYLRPLLSSQQQGQPMSSQAAVLDSASAGAGAAAQALQLELAPLLQLWDQDLLPKLQQAQQLFKYALYCKEADATALPAQVQPITKQIDTITHASGQTPDSTEVIRKKLRVVAGCPLLQQLPQQLETAGHELCALLPLPLCCNNPLCRNVSRQSELQLVGGKACVCAGCEVARYCGQECQAAHWQAHKRVCKLVKKSKRASSSSTTA